jgi:FkbM family methyltransferase
MGHDIHVPMRWFAQSKDVGGGLKSSRRRVIHPLLRSARFSCEGADAKASLLEGHSNAVVVEVGAHDGEDTVAYARHPNVARVYAFEATPWHRAAMRVRLNRAGPGAATKVRSYFSAVSNVTRSDPIPLYVRRDGNFFVESTNGTINNAAEDGIEYGGALDRRGVGRGRLDAANMLADNRFLFAEPGETVEVPVTTLSDVVREHVDLLETDTQGHEFHVLLGAEALMDEFGIDTIVMEFSPRLMHANGANPEEMLDWLHDKGYACFDCTDFHAPPLLGSPGEIRTTLGEQTSRTFGAFSRSFGNHYFSFGDAGQWANLVCIRL